MSRMAATFLTVALAGCATAEYYVPISGADPREYDACGTPGGYGGVKLTEDASIGVSMSPADDAFWINLQISLFDGATFEFLADSVVFTAKDARPVELVISPTPGGRLPSLDPRAPLVAPTPYRPYIINLRAPAGRYSEASLRLPPMRVDGQVFPERNIAFVHRKRTGVISCVQ